MPMNDNDPTILGTTASLPDAHGQAALLLVESLIHGLCEDSTLSNAKAIDIVETAVDVQHEKAEAEAEDTGGASRWKSPTWKAHTLLSSIAASLEFDGFRKPPRPRLV